MAAGHSAGQHRKGRSLPSDLAAPITGEIERQLEELIRKFGDTKVRDALTPLVTKCKWGDWLCVANAIDRLARKIDKRRAR